MQMNVPNLLSALRIALIPFFIYFFTSSQDEHALYYAGIVLALSGLTDMLDGVIARKFNMITQLGKILDPLADKLTQAAVMVCLWIRFPKLWPIVVLLLSKEVLTLVGSVKLFKKSTQVQGSQWFGKLYTVAFYFMTILIVVIPDLQMQFIAAMLLILAVLMIFSLLMYVRVYYKIHQKHKNGS